MQKKKTIGMIGRFIAGLETADAGSILFSGEDTTDVHVRERQVGFVFQHYALFKHMTVFENVAYGLTVKPKKFRPSKAEIAKKVNNLLELVQLGWTADRYPSQLSGGQRQRIALARALYGAPSLVVLDEPNASLDDAGVAALSAAISRFRQLGKTVVMVTHRADVLRNTDALLVLQGGRVKLQRVVIQLARLLHRLGRVVGRHDQDVRHAAGHRDHREVLQRIVARSLVEADVEHHRALRDQAHRVAVGRSRCHRRHHPCAG